MCVTLYVYQFSLLFTNKCSKVTNAYTQLVKINWIRARGKELVKTNDTSDAYMSISFLLELFLTLYSFFCYFVGAY